MLLKCKVNHFSRLYKIEGSYYAILVFSLCYFVFLFYHNIGLITHAFGGLLSNVLRPTLALTCTSNQPTSSSFILASQSFSRSVTVL